MFSAMLTIKTTDTQILVSKDGSEFEGFPKNSVRYKPSRDQLCLFFGFDINAYFWEYWTGGITINDIEVTRNNVNEVLEPLFTESGGTGMNEFPADMEFEIQIKKKIADK